jgi:hypothetical protein
MMTDREKLEAAKRRVTKVISDACKDVDMASLQQAGRMSQAAREQARLEAFEEAAKIAEGMVGIYAHKIDDPNLSATERVCKQVAAAIRARIEPTSEGSRP